MMMSNNSITIVVASLVSSVVMFSNVQAQTVLSGDHVVEGKLDVGTSTDKGGLKIVGETGVSSSPGIDVSGDGGVVFKGTLGQGSIPAQGPGTRFVWYPKKGALRAGTAEMDEWNDASIGINSVALGAGWAHAPGYSSIALGISEAWGTYSLAASGGEAMEFCSVGMSMGVALGEYAVGMSGGWALGYCSTAMAGGLAEARESLAIGPGAWAVVPGSVVVGQYNDPLSPTRSNELFVVGNGTGNELHPDETRYRNAFVILKNGDAVVNGNVKIGGKIEMPRHGDILMGEFGQ